MDPLDIRYCPGEFGSKHLGHTPEWWSGIRCADCGEPAIWTRLDIEIIAKTHPPLENRSFRSWLSRRYHTGRAFLPVHKPKHLVTAPFKRFIIDQLIARSVARPTAGI